MEGQVLGRQTVSRATLSGVMQVLSQANVSARIRLPVDATYVANGAVWRGHLESGSNGDLWSIGKHELWE